MIQIYTGNGKGKTTAALGLAIRAFGQGMRVRIIQFMKGNSFTGELASLAKLGIEVYQFGRPCPFADQVKSGQMGCQGCDKCWIDPHEIEENDRLIIDQAWQLARDSIRAGLDMLILDEFINAFDAGLLPSSEVINWLSVLPGEIELVMTGRNAPPELIEIADLVSEIKLIKHPYQRGISARRGIEY